MNFFTIGVISGIMLFLGKWYISNLALSIVPKLKHWIHKTPLALVTMDFGFGALATPVVQIAGGTTAMITLITFGFCSACFIASITLTNKVKKLCSF